MLEFLTSADTVIFEDAYVFEARVSLEVLYPLPSQYQKQLDLAGARIPKLTVMAWVFDQYFVRSHRSHAIVQSVPPPAGFPFYAIQRCGMHRRTRRPGITFQAGRTRDDLQRFLRIGTKAAFRLSWRHNIRHIVACNHPGAGYGIFAKLHGLRKALRSIMRQLPIQSCKTVTHSPLIRLL